MLKKVLENVFENFSGLKFYSISVSSTTKFYSISVSLTTKFYSVSMSQTTKFYSVSVSPTTALVAQAWLGQYIHWPVVGDT